MKNSMVISVRINPRVWEKLRKIAAKLDRPISWVIRKALEKAV